MKGALGSKGLARLEPYSVTGSGGNWGEPEMGHPCKRAVRGATPEKKPGGWKRSQLSKVSQKSDLQVKCPDFHILAKTLQPVQSASGAGPHGRRSACSGQQFVIGLMSFQRPLPA